MPDGGDDHDAETTHDDKSKEEPIQKRPKGETTRAHNTFINDISIGCKQ
jgi:hypothetical protein